MVSAALALGLTVAALALVSGLGIWYSRGRVDTVEEYISARNSTGAGATTATLIASGMGAWILFSPAEAGAAFGGVAAVVGYGLGSATPLVVYVRLGPRIRELMPEGHTLTEYALARYGRAMYAYVLVVSVLYMFVFLAAEMTGIAGALSLVAGVPGWQTATLVGVFVLAYTGYGGLVASIFTDTVQTLVLLPVMAVGFAGAVFALGGTGTIHRDVVAANPQLLDPTFLGGVEFGVYVVIAVLGAEMLNQAWWQRIYAARDAATLRRAFAVAAVAVVPMVMLPGLFGLAAAGLGLLGSGDASIAFFLVLNEAFPEPVVLAVVVLAVLLVMSTADTLFNAIASVVTADLPRLLADPDRGTLRTAARGLTVAVALGAILIGAQGYSVLELFFTADLLATATFVPLLHGLYSERPTGASALVASIAGLAVGLVFFPTLRPTLSALPVVGGLLPASRFLFAFGGAAVVAGTLSVLGGAVSGGEFDLGSLATEVRRLEDPATEPDGGTERTEVERR
jgi:Na+/proline symporter